MLRDVASGPQSTLPREALVRLLDDESPVVREAVREELERQGPAAIAWLRTLEKGSNRVLANHARRFLVELHAVDPVGDFSHFIASLQYELETGSILLERTVFPDSEAGKICGQLDRLAERCRELMVSPSPAWERCKVINRVLFHESGFRGNKEDFENPLNSFLGQVLRRRKGLPITLAIIYLLVADRCGLELAPIGAPGRFLVGCFLEEDPFFIDVFERGAFRSMDDIETIFRGNAIPLRAEYLTPAPVGEVLQRCCRNLARHYETVGDEARAALFARFVREFDQVRRRHAES